MDFNQRGNRPASPTATSHSSGTPPVRRTRSDGNLRYFFVVLLFSIAVLLGAVISSIALSRNNPNDSKFVDTKRYQAVFMTGGQVYFGQINRLAKKSIVLSDIYYLKVNQQVQPGQPAGANDVTLVKLGCELHGPDDQMVINRDQVIFWENLKDSGQVSQAIKNYQAKNPDPQKCETTAQTSSTPTPTPPPAANKKP